MLDKSSVYNVVAEGINFLGKKVHQISTFWTFHCLSEVAQIPHVIFETRSQLWYKLCTNNTGVIDMKMHRSVLEEKSSFKMLGLTFSSKLDWGLLHYIYC